MSESRKQGAPASRPRLAANKLFHKVVGRGGFVADFPTKETLAEVEGGSPSKPSGDPRDTHKYKLFVSTWNVGGVEPHDDVNLEEWLDTRNNACDIYVLGFQEVVPLNARSVLKLERSTRTRISARWNSLVRAALNRSPPSRADDDDDDQESKPAGGERQKVHPVRDEYRSPKEGSGGRHGFRCVMSKQMVGILVSVWARSDLRRHIRRQAVSRVGCGVMGCLGNKGSVSVRFCLHETSFCFVCCHLASGGKEGDEIRRNSDVVGIFSRTRFPGGFDRDLPRRILHHDRIVLLGDLNYRISLPDDKTRCLVEREDWSTLLESDQLMTEVSKGGAFEGWHEGPIKFSPTYKYYPNSDDYYGCTQRRKGEKRRSPAWCDRILWRGKGLSQQLYDRGEDRLSDHRPVRAIFAAEVDVSTSRNPDSPVDSSFSMLE